MSIEGSVIVERQDANALAYGSAVTAKMLLTGVVSPPDWANELIKTLENCTGLPGGHEWIQDSPAGGLDQAYGFSGLSSPQNETGGGRRSKSKSLSTFPPPSWGKQKDTGSYFNSLDGDSTSPSIPSAKPVLISHVDSSTSDIVSFPVRFESDFRDSDPTSKIRYSTSGDMNPLAGGHSRHGVTSKSLSIPSSVHPSNPFFSSELPSLNPVSDTFQAPSPPHPTAHLIRAVAEYDFKAIEVGQVVITMTTVLITLYQPGDLGFAKGEVIVITEKSDEIEDWYVWFLLGRRRYVLNHPSGGPDSLEVGEVYSRRTFPARFFSPVYY